jgi:tRNA threonylcarbamoyladenosine biosynthesis protein TsaE
LARCGYSSTGWHVNRRKVITNDAAGTEALGARIARTIPAVRSIYIRGALGAGKTTLVRGLLHALGHEGAVKSPTFTLVEPYELACGAVYHFDLYRLEDPQELELIGVRDYLSGDNVCIVEWPERAGQVLPSPDLEIMIEPTSKDGQQGQQARDVQLQAHTPAGEAVLSGWR